MPTHATQAINITAQSAVPMIDRTKPADAMLDGFFFLALTPNIIPTIPSIRPIHE